MRVEAEIVNPESVVFEVKCSMTLAEWSKCVEIIESANNYYGPLWELLVEIKNVMARIKEREVMKVK